MVGHVADTRKRPELQGLKYVKRLVPLLEGLRDCGCARDRAGNRSLHFDQYCLLVLLSLFNPLVRSLRGIRQASRLKGVQRKPGCSRASLGSLSEAVEVFEPERLAGIVEALSARVVPIRDVGSGHFRKTLIAVDGSVVRTLSSIVEAAFPTDKNGDSHGAWRFHTHFDVDRNVPVRIEATPASNGGKNDEKARLRAAVAAGRCCVMDRWYAQFSLWNEVVAAGSDYVRRIRDNSRLDAVIEERSVGEDARRAGVLRDLVADLGSGRKSGERPDHAVRVVLVATTPHEKRGGRKGGTAGPPSDGVLRIATNRIDVPAEVIADVYRHRWTIEVFFRFFKHVLGCRHLLSTHRKGVEIQAYCAIIACLLIALWTNRKPTLRTYEMICFHFAGWATAGEPTSHLKGLKTLGA